MCCADNKGPILVLFLTTSQIVPQWIPEGGVSVHEYVLQVNRKKNLAQINLGLTVK